MTTILEAARERVLVLDGAMGTELMRRGLPRGAAPETWNAERPDEVRAVHEAYYAAGADAVTTNSFGGTRIMLASHGLAGRTVELNAAAARLAVEARPRGRYVLGSLGPAGKMLPPLGDQDEASLEDAYAEQAGALARGGVDALIVETQYDLREALCAVRGSRRAAPETPVFATMTFNSTARGYFTIMGDSVERCLAALEAGGAAAVGANCSLDSARMAALVPLLAGAARLPVIVQANAGQPAIAADGTLSYGQTLDDYVTHVPVMIAAGARMIGGCCGTTPAFIRAIAELVRAGR